MRKSKAIKAFLIATLIIGQIAAVNLFTGNSQILEFDLLDTKSTTIKNLEDNKGMALLTFNGWYTTRVINVTMYRAIIAEDNARIYIENLVVDGTFNDPFYIIAMGNAQLQIDNLNVEVLERSLVIKALDNANIQISGINASILEVGAFDHSTIEINGINLYATASILYPSIYVYSKGHSEVQLRDFNVEGNNYYLTVSTTDNGYVRVDTLNFYPNNGYASFYSTDQSFIEINDADFNSTVSLTVYLSDYSIMRISNSIFNTSSLSFNLQEYTSLFADNVTIDTPASIETIRYNSNGTLYLEDSYVKRIYVDPTSSILSMGTHVPTYTTIVLNNTVVDTFTHFGMQRATLFNSEITNYYAAHVYIGDLNITNNVVSMASGTIGPYPFVNISSSITNLYNLTYTYLLDGQFVIDTSTIDDMIITVNGKLIVKNSALNYGLMTYYSNVQIENITGSLMFNMAYSSNVTITDSDDLSASILAAMGSNVLVTGNNITSLDISSSSMDIKDTVSVVNNNIKGSSPSFSIYMASYNHTVNIEDLYALPGTGAISGFWNINGTVNINRVNLTGSLFVEMHNANAVLSNSLIGDTSYLSTFSLYSSTVKLVNTTLNGRATVDENSILTLRTSSYVNMVSYNVYIAGGTVEIVDGIIRTGNNYASGLIVDGTSRVSNAVPEIYMASQLTVANSTIEAVYILGDATLNLYNTTVNYGVIVHLEPGMDPRSISVNGIINASDVNSVMIAGYGNVLIVDSQVGLLASVLTNITVNSSTIGILVDTYYVTNGTASIDSNTVNNFDGSYVAWDSTTTITTTVYGVAGFGTSNITVVDSNATAFFAFENSTINVSNATVLDTSLASLLVIMGFDHSRITINDTIAKVGVYQNSLVTLQNYAELEVIRSILSTEVTIMDYSTLTAINSTIGVRPGEFDFLPHGVTGQDSVTINVDSSVIPALDIYSLGGSLTAFNLTSENLNVYNTGNFLLDLMHSKISGIMLSSPPLGITADLIDVNTTSLQIIGSLLTFNWTMGTLMIPSVSIVNSSAYIRGTSSIFFMVYGSNVTMVDVTANWLSLALVSGALRNVTVTDSAMAMMSDVEVYASNISRLALSMGSWLYANDTLFGDIFGLTFKGDIYIDIYYTIYPENNITIMNSLVANGWEEIIAIGTGILALDNGTETYSSTVTVEHMDNYYVNTTLDWKSITDIYGLYIDSHVYANITNYTDKPISILVVKKLASTAPSLTGYYGNTLIANNTMITLEDGMPIENITVQVIGDTLLDEYNVKLNTTIVETGYIRNVTGTLSFNIGAYISGIGTYNIDIEVIDADGNTVTFRVTIVVTPGVAPTIDETITGITTFEIGMSAGNITWILSDDHPDRYYIYINDTIIENNTYTSGEVVLFRINQYITSPGTYNITIVAIDKAGLTTTKTVIVTAYPAEPPTILSSPNNLTINTSETITLEWTAEDRFPATYIIQVNGSTVASGTWSSDSPITYNFSADNPGTYVVTLTVTDEAGHQTTSTVYITVVSPTSQGGQGGQPTQGGLGLDLTIALAIVVALLAIVGIIYYIRKAK